MFRALLCAAAEPLQIVDDINPVREVYGWMFSYPEVDYVPVTYFWDATTGSYIVSQTMQMTLTPPAPSSARQNYQVYDHVALYTQEDYSRLIEYRDEALNSVNDPSDENLLRWRYVTALALETLNRPDEALAEYVAIYEAAPESAWGRLAALHLERVE